MTTATSFCSQKGYLKGGDFIKLLNAPGSSFVATVTAGTPDTITFSHWDRRSEGLSCQ